MLRALFRGYLLRRLLSGSSRRRPPRRYGRGYGHGSGHGHARRSHRGGGGHFIGPFPAYSRRTRGGSRVTVTGCCLPIPLTLAAAPVAAYGVRRATRG